MFVFVKDVHTIGSQIQHYTSSPLECVGLLP